MGYRQGDDKSATDKVYSSPIWWTSLTPGLHHKADEVLLQHLPSMCSKADQWFKARQMLGIGAKPLIEVFPTPEVYRKALTKLEGKDPGPSAEAEWRKENEQ